MSKLAVPGAIINYETRGAGPPLLFISGASGTGNVFRQTVDVIGKDFTAVTYDRRGFSKSYLAGDQDYAHRLDTDADDAAALIKHVSNGVPAYVFATSSGAIVGITLLLRHPQLIKRVMLHEPPLIAALPDGVREPYEEATRKAYEDYRRAGPSAALRGFATVNFSAAEAKQLLDGSNAHSDPFSVGNSLYWFERELPDYPFTAMQLDEMAEHKGKIVFAASAEAGDLPAGRIPQIMAGMLGMRAVVMPGAHSGYQTDPEDFAQALMTYIE